MGVTIGHFEKDPTFADILINPGTYIEDLSRFKYVIPIDASLYRDAPLAAQVTNLYRSRVIGSYFQRKGINIIPLVRWGNEFTYTTKYFKAKEVENAFSFEGSIENIEAYSLKPFNVN